jgi:hypothetical protein
MASMMDGGPAMREFEALRNRVEDTAARLATAQTGRRDRNRSLLDTLARLEAKFAAQEQELAYYRDRIGPLEAANARLSALMGRLLDMVDAGLGSDDDADDPVRVATAKAAAMLENELVSLPPPDQDAGFAEPVSADDAEAAFEDVDGAVLAAEDAAETDDDAADLPQVVRLAVAAAADADLESVDALADALADGLGVQAAGGDSLHPTAADIRALLERVEAAAAVVRAAPRPGAQPARIAPMPARRGTGAAA